MPKVKLFRKSDLDFQPIGKGPGNATFAGIIDGESGLSMGCSLSVFDGRSFPWTVGYDELLICIEGIATVRVGEVAYEVHPGDVMWIPAGTSLRYEGEKALIFTAVSLLTATAGDTLSG